VGELIQRCSRKPVAAQDVVPVPERQVRRHNQAIFFVDRRNSVEEEFGTSLREPERRHDRGDSRLRYKLFSIQAETRHRGDSIVLRGVTGWLLPGAAIPP
jgi:hypothetical protein